MPRVWRRIGLILTLLLAPEVWGRTPQFTPAVNAQVAAARRVASALGVHVLDLSSGEQVYSFHPGVRRILASNTKLVTSAAALDRLGPGFFLETEVLVRGRVAGGVLEGDLAVVGGGDPSLSGRDYLGDVYGPFREWAAALRQLGVRRLAGDLVLVHGLFDAEHVHPDWPRDQLTRWYEAPVAALAFNDSCVRVRVRPGPRPGAPAAVEVEPALELFELASSALTTGARRHQGLAVGREETPAEAWTLTVGGRIHRSAEPYGQWVAVADPVAYFGAALRAALAEEGIEVAGRLVPVAALPPAAGGPWRRVATHRTGLLTVLEVVNKRSQNLYAESVLKLLGARLCGEGSWAAGRRVAEEFLTEAGLAPGAYRLADGSGMSRGNRFTPEQVTRLLRHMFEHRWGEEYLRTLPYSGERFLRWSKRLAQPPYRGNVLAKTGYLAGVSTLSGYAKARSGALYAFSILMNGIRTDSEARAAQDRIVKAVIDHG